MSSCVLSTNSSPESSGSSSNAAAAGPGSAGDLPPTYEEMIGMGLIGEQSSPTAAATTQGSGGTGTGDSGSFYPTLAPPSAAVPPPPPQQIRSQSLESAPSPLHVSAHSPSDEHLPPAYDLSSSSGRERSEEGKVEITTSTNADPTVDMTFARNIAKINDGGSDQDKNKDTKEKSKKNNDTLKYEYWSTGPAARPPPQPKSSSGTSIDRSGSTRSASSAPPSAPHPQPQPRSEPPRDIPKDPSDRVDVPSNTTTSTRSSSPPAAEKRRNSLLGVSYDGETRPLRQEGESSHSSSSLDAAAAQPTQRASLTQGRRLSLTDVKKYLDSTSDDEAENDDGDCSGASSSRASGAVLSSALPPPRRGSSSAPLPEVDDDDAAVVISPADVPPRPGSAPPDHPEHCQEGRPSHRRASLSAAPSTRRPSLADAFGSKQRRRASFCYGHKSGKDSDRMSVTHHGTTRPFYDDFALDTSRSGSARHLMESLGLSKSTREKDWPSPENMLTRHPSFTDRKRKGSFSEQQHLHQQSVLERMNSSAGSLGLFCDPVIDTPNICRVGKSKNICRLDKDRASDPGPNIAIAAFRDSLQDSKSSEVFKGHTSDFITGGHARLNDLSPARSRSLKATDLRSAASMGSLRACPPQTDLTRHMCHEIPSAQSNEYDLTASGTRLLRRGSSVRRMKYPRAASITFLQERLTDPGIDSADLVARMPRRRSILTVRTVKESLEKEGEVCRDMARLRRASRRNSDMMSSSRRNSMYSVGQSSLQGSSHDADSQSSRGEQQLNVSFHAVEVRSYPIMPGDHPCVSSGPPVTLRWEPSDRKVVDLDEYEDYKPEPRKQEEMFMPRSIREDALRSEGYRPSAIRESEQTAKTAKAARKKTSERGLNPIAFKADAALERTRRGIRNIFDRKKKSEEKELLAKGMKFEEIVKMENDAIAAKENEELEALAQIEELKVVSTDLCSSNSQIHERI